MKPEEEHPNVKEFRKFLLRNPMSFVDGGDEFYVFANPSAGYLCKLKEDPTIAYKNRPVVISVRGIIEDIEGVKTYALRVANSMERRR